MIRINHPLYQKDLHDVSEHIQRHWQIVGKKKILVIGATGLIGSFFTDALFYYNMHVQEQFEIYAMGRSIARLRQRFSYIDASRIHLWEHDISLPIKEDIHFDYIFHLASMADPGQYAAYPFETITTNVLGSIHVINYAKTHPGSRVLFTSSMEVYGKNDGDSLKESDYGAIDYNDIRSGYPESKRVSELLYRSAVREYGISGCIARLGYIYGPTMTDNDNKVIAQFIRNAVDGKDLLLKSEGIQRRTYCYVADAVTGMLTVLLAGEDGEAYNVADKNSLVTIRQLGGMIAEQAGVKLMIENRADHMRPSVDKNNAVLNVDKLEQLGWCVKTSIENGIGKTIEILGNT